MRKFATEREKAHDRVLCASARYARIRALHPHCKNAEDLLAQLAVLQKAYKDLGPLAPGEKAPLPVTR